MAVARRERRILLTMDKVTANLIEYPATAHAGVVLFRPGVSGRGGVIRFIRSRLTDLLSRDLEDRVTVVSAQRIRGH